MIVRLFFKDGRMKVFAGVGYFTSEPDENEKGDEKK